jgi:threonine dehydratase
MLARKAEITGKRVAVIICGGNIDQQVIDEIRK